MSKYHDQINKAFDEHELFFKPWIGYKYGSGLLLPHMASPKRVLVIGASRYCEYSNEKIKNGEAPCPYLKTCRLCSDYSTLEKIALACPYINRHADRGGHHIDFKLSDINSASILKAIYDNGTPKAYQKFAKSMGKILERDERDIWMGISFINFIQPIVLDEGSNRTITPSFTHNQGLYRDSSRVVNHIIELLDPDVVFLWYSSPFKKNGVFDVMFPSAKKIYSDQTIKRGNIENELPVFQLNNNNKSVLLFTTPHPSDYAWKDAHIDIEEVPDYSLSSYITPNSFSNPRPNLLKEVKYRPWEDFENNLKAVLLEESL